MTDIQKARDVLAKWRKQAPVGPWRVTEQGFADQRGHEHIQAPYYDLKIDPMVAALIVGTAGNPDLLDAIDALLAEALTVAMVEPVTVATLVVQNIAATIAAAIIAADERMSA